MNVRSLVPHFSIFFIILFSSCSLTLREPGGSGIYFQQSESQSARSDLLFLSRKIEERFSEALQYGADSSSASYKEGKSFLENANQKIETGDLDGASADLRQSMLLANQLIEESLPGYSEKKVQLAMKTLTGTEDSYNQKLNQSGKLDNESIQMIPVIKDYLAAGNEALLSATGEFEAGSLHNALADAEEVIALSSIIQEQIRGLSGNGDATVDNSQYSSKIVADKGESSGPPVSASDDSIEVSDSSSQSSVQQSVQQSDSDSGDSSATYRVKPGDCLWCIAGRKEVYGNPYLWRKIWKANRKMLKNPNRIYPGQKLQIPEK